MIAGQVCAIVWAQWRSIRNQSGRRRTARFWFTLIFSAVWYGMWAFFAWGIATIASDPASLDLLRKALPPGLLAAFLYWQIIPVILASSGVSLDLSRLLVYPIPHRHLFAVEVVLRVTTSLEMLLLTGGLAVGLTRNPRVPVWSVLPLIAFAALNLLLSAGIRDLFTRLMARRGFREVAVLFLVLLSAAPQVLLTRTPSEQWRTLLEQGFGTVWPWSAAARLAGGQFDVGAVLLLSGWTAAAYLFSRWQFDRSLQTDLAEYRARDRQARSGRSLLTTALNSLVRLFPDPLSALIEKEVRSLSRAPRFRLLFFMGFSFGLLIWLPITFRSDPDSVVRSNYLTIVSAYALMLLGELCFWNIFGTDRTAAQVYFVVPVPFSTVLVAKNIAAVFFLALEISIVTLFCAVLRMPVTLADVGEAFAVTAVLSIYMLATGNILSTRYPRAVDPSQSWRSGSMGRVQAYLLFLYPLASIPIMLAYGARYAFDSGLWFYAVLAFDVLLGSVVYWIAMESAVASASAGKEQFLEALSTGGSPAGT